MKFKLSTLLLSIALVVVSASWFADHQRHANAIDDACAVSTAISTSIFTNMIYSGLDTLTDSENASRRKNLLHANVVELYANLGNARFMQEKSGNWTATHDERAICIQKAGESLALLGLLDADNYFVAFVEMWGTDAPYDGMVEQDGKGFTQEFNTFVTDAISRYNETSSTSPKKIGTRGITTERLTSRGHFVDVESE